MPDDRPLIEFWFDFASPYAYFAAQQIEAVAARCGRRVLWRPYMMGVAFRATGMMPLDRMPLRGAYAQHDWQRLARAAGIPFALPPGHPIAALPASRAHYWLEARDPAMAAAFCRRAFAAYFAEGRDMTSVALVAALGAECGADEAALAQGMTASAIRQRLRDETAHALATGIFGAPFFIADGEPFWGADRLPMLEDWLTRGGW